MQGRESCLLVCLLADNKLDTHTQKTHILGADWGAAVCLLIDEVLLCK